MGFKVVRPRTAELLGEKWTVFVLISQNTCLFRSNVFKLKCQHTCILKVSKVAQFTFKLNVPPFPTFIKVTILHEIFTFIQVILRLGTFYNTDRNALLKKWRKKEVTYMNNT